jgi:uncharacterized protein (TIGR03437 family)
MMKPLCHFGILAAFALTLTAQPPSVATGGVVNSASFAKDASGHGAAVAPGSLVSIFGAFPGGLMAAADTVPISTSLGGVTVTFNGVNAPVLAVGPTGAFPFINAQMPFEVLNGLPATASVPVVVTVNGVPSPAQQTPIIPVAPGIFTIPEGVGTAVLVNLTDLSIAAPTNANLGVPTRPIKRGEQAYMYVTGLGAMTPPIQDGANDLVTTHFANSTPIVWIGGVNGGVTAQVIFAGQAPSYPGVGQINLMIPQNAPTGNAVMIQVQSADGTFISPAGVATIAIQ